MQGSNERLIQAAWGTTQENIETAVGTAYSSWTSFNTAYIRPAVRSINQGVGSCFGACFGQPRSSSNNRRDSFDIFFDMYDDDEVFGRDELERLLSVDDEGFGDEDDVYEGEGEAETAETSRRAAGKAASGPAVTDDTSTIGTPVRPLISTAASSTWSSILGIFTFWQSPAQYRPSTADRIGVRSTKLHRGSKLKPINNYGGSNTMTTAGPIIENRARSSTKSSVQSSSTYRSRNELFSDGDGDAALFEDAQIVSDNFAASLVFNGSNRSVSDDLNSADRISTATRTASNSGVSISSLANSVQTGSTDEQLRQEEISLEQTEEKEIEQKRIAALEKAKRLGLDGSTSEDA